MQQAVFKKDFENCLFVCYDNPRYNEKDPVKTK